MTKVTVTSMILDRQQEIARGELTKGRAEELLNELSALLGNCNEVIRERSVKYNQKLLECLRSEETVSRAKVFAETTQEYQDKKEAMDMKELINTLIGSLKYYIRGKSEEYREGKYQI